MTTCVPSPRSGIHGCSRTWEGVRQAHCVARGAWSTHEDGRCHTQWSSNSAADLHWINGKHTDPSTNPAIALIEGVWTFNPLYVAETPKTGDSGRAA
jgi:hypothetical protein